MKTGFIARSSVHLILVLLFLFSSAVAIAQQVERKPRKIDPTLQIEGRMDAMMAKLSLWPVRSVGPLGFFEEAG